eukprot:TRINITY_DN39920_c0_g1_i1.p1 TRINITY_DN39920_c0_g1~~TRINITY_DN39920_c0_g1_i1.p1  ORF type:complete len:414 (-),score=142.61 TRINITY_DN39920_c0_g1_i1:106-1347(-)
MALELHPDKGGDPEKFQELQEMKEKLNELEKEEEEDSKKKNEDEDPEEAEAKRLKEKEEEEEKAKVPPSERIKKLRMDVHDNSVRLWERAKKSRDELSGDKALRSNSQPALQILRLFVDRFVQNEIKTLRHDDTKGAEAKLRKFLKQGAEILAVAALSDVQSTLSTLAMHFNYRLVARSGSAEIREKCAALLEAVGEVPRQAEAFLEQIERSIQEQKDRDRARKEHKAAEQREREARGDFGGEASAAPKGAATPSSASKPSRQGYSSTSSQPPTAPKGAFSRAAAGAAAATNAPKTSGAADPFADFDFGSSDKTKKPEAKAKPQAVPTPAPTSQQVATTKSEDDRSSIAAAMKPKRTSWDPNFDHPYAGALKSNGTGIYCRPCQRWIVTYEYSTDVFLTHVERVHPKPPAGWN